MCDRAVIQQQTTQRFKNMSSLETSVEMASLLDKGPKFALTQTISDKTLNKVDIGVEKANNSIRWNKFWSQHTTTTPSARLLPFLSKKSRQAPKADPVTELELCQLKKRLLSTYRMETGWLALILLISYSSI